MSTQQWDYYLFEPQGTPTCTYQSWISQLQEKGVEGWEAVCFVNPPADKGNMRGSALLLKKAK